MLHVATVDPEFADDPSGVLHELHEEQTDQPMLCMCNRVSHRAIWQLVALSVLRNRSIIFPLRSNSRYMQHCLGDTCCNVRC